MFREMRRKNQLLSEEETVRILTEGSSGTLAVLGDGGYPYAVPLSYVYRDGKIFFHAAKTGHKTDAIQKESKASFCVIGQDRVLPEKFTTCFRSVIAFGRVKIVEDERQKRAAIALLAEKYSPGLRAESEREIEREYASFCILEFNVEHMTGKEAIELVRSRT